MPTGLVMALLLVLATGGGCASARYVSKGQCEGVVAIASPSARNREKAEELMAAHFPEGYELLLEEEVVVGEETRHVAETQREKKGEASPREVSEYYAEHDAAAMKNLHGSRRSMEEHAWTNPRFSASSRSRTVGRSETRQKTEWRLTYRRKAPTGETPQMQQPVSLPHTAPGISR